MPGGRRQSIDLAAVAQGASASFTVFVVGLLATPLAFKLGTEVGLVYPVVVTVAASCLAGVKASTASTGGRAVVQGLAAALCGYALLFPLILIGSIRIESMLLVGVGATAVVSGGAAAYVHARLGRSEGHE